MWKTLVVKGQRPLDYIFWRLARERILFTENILIELTWGQLGQLPLISIMVVTDKPIIDTAPCIFSENSVRLFSCRVFFHVTIEAFLWSAVPAIFTMGHAMPKATPVAVCLHWLLHIYFRFDKMKRRKWRWTDDEHERKRARVLRTIVGWRRWKGNHCITGKGTAHRVPMESSAAGKECRYGLIADHTLVRQRNAQRLFYPNKQVGPGFRRNNRLLPMCYRNPPWKYSIVEKLGLSKGTAKKLAYGNIERDAVSHLL